MASGYLAFARYAVHCASSRTRSRSSLFRRAFSFFHYGCHSTRRANQRSGLGSCTVIERGADINVFGDLIFSAAMVLLNFKMFTSTTYTCVLVPGFLAMCSWFTWYAVGACGIGTGVFILAFGVLSGSYFVSFAPNDYGIFRKLLFRSLVIN